MGYIPRKKTAGSLGRDFYLDIFFNDFLKGAEQTAWMKTSDTGAQRDLARKSAPRRTHRNGCNRSSVSPGTRGAAEGPEAVKWRLCFQTLLPLTSGMTLGKPLNLLSLLVLRCEVGTMTVIMKERMMVVVAVVMLKR